MTRNFTCKSKRRCAGARVWASQPARGARDSADGDDGAALRPEDMDALLSHSQPAHADDLLLATQEPEGGAVCARVVRRLSRVWVRCDEREALRALQDALRQHRYDFRRLDKRTVSACVRASSLRSLAHGRSLS